MKNYRKTPIEALIEYRNEFLANMTNNHKNAIGHTPNWLAACRYLIDEQGNLPENMKFLHITKDGFPSLFEEKLNDLFCIPMQKYAGCHINECTTYVEDYLLSHIRTLNLRIENEIKKRVIEIPISQLKMAESLMEIHKSLFSDSERWDVQTRSSISLDQIQALLTYISQIDKSLTLSISDYYEGFKQAFDLEAPFLEMVLSRKPELYDLNFQQLIIFNIEKLRALFRSKYDKVRYDYFDYEEIEKSELKKSELRYYGLLHEFQDDLLASISWFGSGLDQGFINKHYGDFILDKIIEWEVSEKALIKKHEYLCNSRISDKRTQRST